MSDNTPPPPPPPPPSLPPNDVIKEGVDDSSMWHNFGQLFFWAVFAATLLFMCAEGIEFGLVVFGIFCIGFTLGRMNR